VDPRLAPVTVVTSARLIWSVLPSPVGDLLLTGDPERLTGIFFSPHKSSHLHWDRAQQAGTEDDEAAVMAATRRQLGEYFEGARTAFDLPLAPAGTAFQLRVWAALTEIPYGETQSYGKVAQRLGLIPGASRAVGLANGANPISIVVPCHRVIGADGSLTGYGGGLDRKRLLLDLERGSLF
jgi:methylated-DNA-[protein]-cysteine S-methyltransferase